MRGWALLLAAVAALAARVRGEDPERGDVPGWVMITVMTAALVLAILIPFREAIVNAVVRFVDRTSGGDVALAGGATTDASGHYSATVAGTRSRSRTCGSPAAGS